MDRELKATLIEKGTSLVADLFRTYLLRPASPVARTSPEPAVTQAVADPPTKTQAVPTVITERPKSSYQPITNELSTGVNTERDYRWECLPAGTTIYGRECIRDINGYSAVNHGQKYSVRTHTGRYQTPNGWMNRNYNGNMKNIDFWYTNIPLIITPNHPILGVQDVRVPQSSWRDGGIDEDKLDWFKSESITERDFIAFPRITDTIDMDIVSPLLSELFGWYLSEGNVDKQSGAITISLCHSEVTEIQRVVYIITSLLGKEPRVDNGGTATRIVFSCDPLATVLAKQFGDGAVNKKIPSWFLTLPENKQYPLLKSLLNGDGSLVKYTQQYTTSSKTLAYQLRLLLFRLGIIHGLLTRPIITGNIDGREIHPTVNPWDIKISGDALRLLMRQIGIQHDQGVHTSGNFGYVSENYVFLPVKSVNDKPFNGQVYNIGVNYDESYLTIHGAVHNCLNKHMGAASVLLREAFERANDSGVGDGSAEKIMEALNEHAGAEADLDAMNKTATGNSDEVKELHTEMDKIYSGIRQFRAAAWKADLTVGGGTKEDIEAAREWNNLMLQEVYNNAKKHKGYSCIASGM